MKEPKFCPITGDEKSELIFEFNSPPKGEPKIIDFKQYNRKVFKFFPSNHFISICDMNLDNIYDDKYLNANYESETKMSEVFEKIISLPNSKSDNIGRFKAIKKFSKSWFSNISKPYLLDVGSGTGVFPYIVKKNGWKCLAIDPDKRSVNHIKEKIGINAIHGDFFEINPVKKFNIISLNKVIEHVKEPIKMLKLTKDWLLNDGFVYIEVPDGEMASRNGKDRGEFYIDHFHIFSIASVSIMANKAGYCIQNIYRLKEPSDKFTIRAFLSKI